MAKTANRKRSLSISRAKSNVHLMEKMFAFSLMDRLAVEKLTPWKAQTLSRCKMLKTLK